MSTSEPTGQSQLDPRLEPLLARSAILHDHLCPRQVLGVRMGLLAADLLGLEVPQSDKRLLTIVETDGCFVDGVSAATGCWIGRRTLRCVDFGKVAATFIDTLTGDAVRIHPAPEARQLAGQYAPEAESRWHAYLLGYQVMPAAELLTVESVRLAVPVAEIISRPDLRAICTTCGEEIFNGREVRQDGMVRCQACAGQEYLLREQTSIAANGARRHER